MYIDILIEQLKKVKDFRKNKGKRHELWLILLITILACMCGYTSYRAIGDFANSNKSNIIKLFNIYPERIPSYSTIRREIKRVNFLNTLQNFNEWAKQLCLDNSLQKWVAIDGKSLRNTLTNIHNNQQNFISMISLFNQDNGIVLNLKIFENKKQSEIHQTQDCIRDCQLKNTIFTMDSLHCQKKTTQLITQNNNDYLIAVKRNQPTLYKQIEQVSNNCAPIDVFSEKDKSHGRNIERTVSVFKPVLNLVKGWTNVKTFIKVERRGFRGKEYYEETVFYISSLTESAKLLASKIRGHWKIENCLHWVKDVILDEDTSLIHEHQPAINISILKTIAINLIKLMGNSQ